VGILMKTLLLNRRQFVSLSTSALLIGTALRASADSPAIAVVVGAKSAQRVLSLDQLQRVFLNKDTNDVDGNRFVPLNQRNNSDERARFDARVLGMTPDEAARYWIDQRLRGKRAPATATWLMLRRALNELPGAISYVAANAVDSSIRVLSIDGHLPSDSAYPIR
jgi:ABC-type phosphate transport system substrate-binding protein